LCIVVFCTYIIVTATFVWTSLHYNVPHCSLFYSHSHTRSVTFHYLRWRLLRLRHYWLPQLATVCVYLFVTFIFPFTFYVPLHVTLQRGLVRVPLSPHTTTVYDTLLYASYRSHIAAVTQDDVCVRTLTATLHFGRSSRTRYTPGLYVGL